MPDIAAARPVSGQPIETSWGQQAHDAVEGIQHGVVQNGPFSATVVITTAVVFPRAYATPPTIVLSMASVVCQSRSFNITTTGFSIDSKRNDGSASLTTQPVAWMAVGTLA